MINLKNLSLKNKFNFKLKKTSEKISNSTEKVLKILIIIVIFLFSLFCVIEYGFYMFNKNEIKTNLEKTNKEIEELEKNKNDLSKLSHGDIIKIKGVFENKEFNEKILKFKTKQVEFLEKVLRKDTNKFYVTIKIPFEAEKEIDLRKYLLLQSLNKKIYKLTDIRKDKENIIELIYEL